MKRSDAHRVRPSVLKKRVRSSKSSRGYASFERTGTDVSPWIVLQWICISIYGLRMAWLDYSRVKLNSRRRSKEIRKWFVKLRNSQSAEYQFVSCLSWPSAARFLVVVDWFAKERLGERCESFFFLHKFSGVPFSWSFFLLPYQLRLSFLPLAPTLLTPSRFKDQSGFNQRSNFSLLCFASFFIKLFTTLSAYDATLYYLRPNAIRTLHLFTKPRLCLQ